MLYEKNFLVETSVLQSEFSHKHLRLWRISLKQYKTLSYFVFWKKKLSTQLKSLYTLAWETRKWRISAKKSKKLLWWLDKKELVLFQEFCINKSIKYQKKFIKLLGKQLIDKELFYTIKDHIETIPEDDMLLLYSTFKAKVTQSIQEFLKQKKICDEDLHDIRKETKHLLYFAQMVGDDSMKEYKTMSKYLWRRNDTIELVLSLKQRNKQYCCKHNKKIITSFKQSTKIQKKEIIAYLTLHFTR